MKSTVIFTEANDLRCGIQDTQRHMTCGQKVLKSHESDAIAQRKGWQKREMEAKRLIFHDLILRQNVLKS